MNRAHKILYYLLIVFQISLFGWMYRYGPHGAQKINPVQKDIKYLEKEVICLKNEIEIISQDIALYQSHSFFKEKIAREQLQMAAIDDVVYYYS